MPDESFERRPDKPPNFFLNEESKIVMALQAMLKLGRQRPEDCVIRKRWIFEASMVELTDR